MKLIRPITIDDAALLSTNVPEPSPYSYWTAWTYAAVGDRYVDSTTHKVYEAIQIAPFIPLTDEAYWVEVSASNRWAMFDQVNSTQSTQADSIAVSVQTTGRIDSVALVNVSAASAYITASVTGPLRYNLLLKSEKLDNAAWTKTRTSIAAADAVAAPNLTTTADKIIEDGTSSATHVLIQDVSVTAGESYTYSIYAKAAERSVIQIATSTNMGGLAGGSNVYQNFNLATGELGSGSSSTETNATITSVGNDWYRCTLSGTATATGSGRFTLSLQPGPNKVWIQAYDGDGVSGLYLWGAQIEQGSSATSYIPTDEVSVGSTDYDVYAEGFSLISDSAISDWYGYFFEDIVRVQDFAVTDIPLYYSPKINVSLLDSGATVAIGTLVIGQSYEIGGTLYGAEIGIVDYSRKEVDDFGAWEIVERSFAKRGKFTVFMDNSAINLTRQMLQGYRATPIVWVGSDDYESTIIYGFYRTWAIEIAYPTKSYCTLEIEGLT